MNLNIEGMMYEELLLLRSGVKVSRLPEWDLHRVSSDDRDGTIIIGGEEKEVTPINSIKFVREKFLILLFLDSDDKKDNNIKKLFIILKTISLANPLTLVDICIISDYHAFYKRKILSKLESGSNSDRDSYISVTSNILKSMAMRFLGIRVYHTPNRLKKWLKK